MKIGIFVYSVSDHTLTVAHELQERLSATGHEVTLERIETVGPSKLSNEEAPLRTKPAVQPYDALVFACPVRGGTVPSPMRRYLEQLPSLEGKRVAFLVTHFFRRAWGAEQTLAQMEEIRAPKGATVVAAEDVRWFGLRRKQQIEQVVDELSQVF
jgi:multimeric flavodoxin WrbA